LFGNDILKDECLDIISLASLKNMATNMNDVASIEFLGLVWVLHGQIPVFHGQVWSLFSPNVSFGV
jgi:hypothetical protein